MSYQSVDESSDNGQPVELYHFQQVTNSWYYTSGAEEITKSGITYEPANITRSVISQSNEISGSRISLDFPRDHLFAAQFLGFTPDLVTTLTIMRGHATDSTNEYQAYWKGRVISGSGTGSVITLECESVFTSMKRVGLRARFQVTCRHTLYSAACGVNLNSSGVAGIATSSSSNILVCSQASSYADGTFTGGMVQTTSGALRFITSHTGSSLVLSRPFLESVGGQSITLFPGCDHLQSTCKDKFNNLPNFGGFPYIPIINPFGGSSIV